MQAILAAPMGMVRLTDMLGEREAIRNEALLLLTGLAREDSTIQQIAAFEGAFERLLSIIRQGLHRLRNIPGRSLWGLHSC